MGRLIACTLYVSIVSIGTITAQPSSRGLDMKAQVLDALFPLEVEAKTYFMKMVLRFGDSDTQLVVIVHPGAKAEVLRFRLADLGGVTLERFISRMLAQNAHSSIDYTAIVAPAIEELKAIQISPALATRVSADNYSEYEFGYDTGQESVHYTITGPFQNTSQDELGKWMLRFRATLERFLKAGSADKP